MIVNVSEVTPSVCINARSTNSPTQKPATAPSVEPHSSPTNATSSGVRSTLTPNTGISETTLIWTNTTTTDSTATRHTNEPGSQAVPLSRPRAEWSRSMWLSACRPAARSSAASSRLRYLAALGFFFWTQLMGWRQVGGDVAERGRPRAG